MQPWYKGPAAYTFILQEGGLREADYLEAIDAVLEIVPFLEAQEKTAADVKAGVELNSIWLYPTPWHYLRHNPLHQLLSNFWPPNNNCLIELVRLGRDLVATRDIPGIKSIHNRLRIDEDYIGALFEIEVLAEFSRGGLRPVLCGTPDFRVEVDDGPFYIEIKHRNVPFPVAVWSEIRPPFDWGDDWGELTIELDQGAGGGGENPVTLARDIVQHCANVVSSKPEDRIQQKAKSFTISYDPAGGLRTITLRFGKPGTDFPMHEIFAYHVSSLLKDKAELQLANVAGDHIIALDLRAFSMGEKAMESAVNAHQYAAVGPALISAIHDFLSTSSIVHGVLTWSRGADTFSSAYDRLHKSNEVMLIAGDREVALGDAGSIADLMRNLRPPGQPPASL